MRRLIAAAAFLVLLAAPLGAQEQKEKPAVSAAATDALAKGAAIMNEAQAAFSAKEWDRSIQLYADAVSAFGATPELGGWRDQALYNTACAHARAGRKSEAAETFAKSVADGLRPVRAPGPLGGWQDAPGLTLEHVLVDSDLDPIRAEPAYVAALKPYLAAGEPIVEVVGDAAQAKLPAIVVLAAEGEDAERALPAWRVAARGRSLVFVALAGPVRATPTERLWFLRDGDDRWAAAKVKETLDHLARDARLDVARVFVVGVGARPGEAAWAAAMADTSRVAGFAAPGARFHAAWHADEIAKLSAGTRVALAPTDVEAAKMLKERGVEAALVEPSKDESATAAAILDAMLGPK